MARTVDPEAYTARRAAILGAAAEVFAQRGYDGATTAAICRRARIGSGTLFHYFADKRSILVALFEEDLTETRSAIAALDRTDPVAAIHALLDRLTADLMHPLAPGLLIAALQAAFRDAEFGAMLQEGDGVVRAALAQLIAAAQQHGDVDGRIDPVRAARWVHGLVDAAYLMSGDDAFEAAGDIAELRRITSMYLGLA